MRGLELAQKGCNMQALFFPVPPDPHFHGRSPGAAMGHICALRNNLTWIMHCSWYCPRTCGCHRCHGTGCDLTCNTHVPLLQLLLVVVIGLLSVTATIYVCSYLEPRSRTWPLHVCAGSNWPRWVPCNWLCSCVITVTPTSAVLPRDLLRVPSTV